MKLSVISSSFLVSVFVIIFGDQITQSEALIEDVLDVIHVLKEVTTGVLKAWDIAQQSGITEQNMAFPLNRNKEKKVLARLKEVNRRISETEEKVYTRTHLFTINWILCNVC